MSAIEDTAVDWIFFLLIFPSPYGVKLRFPPNFLRMRAALYRALNSKYALLDGTDLPPEEKKCSQYRRFISKQQVLTANRLFV
jgi:hypothetical protein